jgi:hypothetical protein
MKRIFIVAMLAGLAFSGCGDAKKQEKDLLDSVIQIHDRVMGKDDKLMHNKMKLDTLLKTKLTGVPDTAAAKAMLMGLKIQLSNAEDGMENWMQKFTPDQSGKSHQDIMNYYSIQKKQITAIDSTMGAAINASNKYLSQLHN